jgi:asparagine synthase (glutamine-hydrolysing)
MGTKEVKRFLKRIPSQTKKPPVLSAVLADSLTYLGEDALNDLYEQVTRLENEGSDGILIEAGCALGGSAIVIATAKSSSRPFYVYDMFGMIPPPSDRDGEDVHKRYEIIKSGKSSGIGGQKYYGYEENLFDKVGYNFSRYNVPIDKNNVYLVKGLFQDTLYVQDKVALAHIDVDWYESVKTCLERIEPHLIAGSVLVIDDYDHWSGCKNAVDDILQRQKGSV